eukprot:m.142190 g.142190  ORF g.142190 m.142190 type:complete len:906 (+) comp16147_c0_seq4:73-2790(+)
MDETPDSCTAKDVQVGEFAYAIAQQTEQQAIAPMQRRLTKTNVLQSLREVRSGLRRPYRGDKLLKEQATVALQNTTQDSHIASKDAVAYLDRLTLASGRRQDELLQELFDQATSQTKPRRVCERTRKHGMVTRRAWTECSILVQLGVVPVLEHIFLTSVEDTTRITPFGQDPRAAAIVILRELVLRISFVGESFSRHDHLLLKAWQHIDSRRTFSACLTVLEEAISQRRTVFPLRPYSDRLLKPMLVGAEADQRLCTAACARLLVILTNDYNEADENRLAMNAALRGSNYQRSLRRNKAANLLQDNCDVVLSKIVPRLLPILLPPSDPASLIQSGEDLFTHYRGLSDLGLQTDLMYLLYNFLPTVEQVQHPDGLQYRPTTAPEHRPKPLPDVYVRILTEIAAQPPLYLEEETGVEPVDSGLGGSQMSCFRRRRSSTKAMASPSERVTALLAANPPPSPTRINIFELANMRDLRLLLLHHRGYQVRHLAALQEPVLIIFLSIGMTETLFVLSNILHSQQRIRAQQTMARFGLVQQLLRLNPHLGWTLTNFNHVHGAGPHGPDCTCNPVSSLKIHYLRLVQELVETTLGMETGALLFTEEEQTCIDAIAIATQTGLHSQASAALDPEDIARYRCKGPRGLITTLIDNYRTQTPAGNVKGHLASVLENTARGLGPAYLIFMAESGLLDLVLTDIMHPYVNPRHQEEDDAEADNSPIDAHQYLMDLLAALILRCPHNVLKLAQLVENNLERFLAIVYQDLVASNMILRAMWVASEVLDESTPRGLELQRTALFQFCNHPDVMRESVVSLFASKGLVDLSQSCVSVFNTGLYCLHLLHKRNKLGAVLEWLLSEHSKLAMDLRAFVLFWQLHYPGRPKDLESLRISCSLRLNDWGAVIAAIIGRLNKAQSN